MAKKIKGKFNGEPMPIEQARAISAERKKVLDAIPVELQVIDVDHAKSKEVLDYCIDKLSAGVAWGELRRMLGVGPSSVDRRWRTIRDLVLSIALPENEEEALKARYSKGAFLLQKLEKFIDEIEARLEVGVEAKVEHNFFKIKLDGLKYLLEQNEKDFEHYVEMRKVKSIDRKSQGPSVIIQNNYHIPRPGDNTKDVTSSDMAEIVGSND